MALALGTNSGFVAVAPVDDPDGAANYGIGTLAVAQRDDTPATAVKITEIGFYCPSQNDEEPNWEVGIYDDDTAPVNLLAGEDRTNVLSTGVGWKRVTGLNITVSPETTYWIGVQIDTDATVNYDVSGTGMGFYMYLAAQTTLPDPWVGGSGTTRISSIYAVWEAAAEEKEAQIISIILSKLLLPFLWLKQEKAKRREFLRNSFLAMIGIK